MFFRNYHFVLRADGLDFISKQEARKDMFEELRTVSLLFTNTTKVNIRSCDRPKKKGTKNNEGVYSIWFMRSWGVGFMGSYESATYHKQTLTLPSKFGVYLQNVSHKVFKAFATNFRVVTWVLNQAKNNQENNQKHKKMKRTN